MTDADLHDFYTHRCDEATRLDASLKGRLEAARVRELLAYHLPASTARIADIGGGTGAHAEWLQAAGHKVELVDPIRRHVQAAKQVGIKARVGDARDLPWPDSRFDLALLAGPLYHLTASGDRKMALHEAARVVRPGGVVVVVAFNRHANLVGATLANQLVKRRDIVDDIEAAGHSDRHDRVSSSTYYHSLPELVDELTNANLDDVTVHGLTGPGGWLAITIDAHFPDPLSRPPTLTDVDPLVTAMAGARLADRYPELAPREHPPADDRIRAVMIPTARKLREAAVEYAAHDWPVAPLAVPVEDICPCSGVCQAMHVLDDHADGITSEAIADKVWGDHGWPIAIVTSRFDVVDLTGAYGSRIHGRLKTRCPTATARPGRRLDWTVEPGPVRWHLYLQQGSLDPERVANAGGVLHSGGDDWVAVPPSRTPQTGRVGWVVPPKQARWTPYRRGDVFDMLGLA